jgi:uncharacterized membrane protein
MVPVAEGCATPEEDEDCDGHAWSSDGDTDCACEPGTSQDCYTGPDGTHDIGVCHSGTWICNDDGLGWGTCENEVTPAANEDCSTSADDEDCDGHAWFSDGDTDCACEPGTTKDCYTGPPTTQDVGVCRGGTWACNPDGLGFNECVGEVVPTPEACGDAVISDDDCSGGPCGGDALWALKAGGSGDQVTYDLTVDANGNVVVVGYFATMLTLGTPTPTTLTSQGGNDAFVVKLDSDGNPLWASRFGGPSDQQAYSVAVDTAGNIFVAGGFEGSLTAGGTTLTAGAKDAFVLKLAPNSSVLWAKNFGDNVSDQQAWGVAVTGQGNPVLTGDFIGSIDFGTGGSTNLTSAGEVDVFVACLQGSNGNHVWSRRFGDSATQRARSIAVGNAVYVTGYVEGTFSVGNDSINAGTSSDPLALRLATTDGTPVWGKSSHGPSDDNSSSFGRDIAVDSASNVLLTGQFAGTINFGGADLTESGYSNGFVARFTTDGTHAWSKAFGNSTTLDLDSHGVAADAANNVLLTGQFAGTADFGGGPITASGIDLFVAKLDPNGTYLWSRRFGNPADQIGRSVGADPAGDVLVAGHFKGTLDFNTAGTSLTANGDTNTLFVAKLAK